MKQQYLIFGIVFFTIVIFFAWTFIRKQDMPKSPKIDKKTSLKNDKAKVMEIQKSDIEQKKEIDDILYDLTQKYYPDYDDDSFNELDIVSQTFALVIDADGQIQNGGIIQFIDNGTGNRFHETIDAARRIKNDSLVAILTSVTSQYPKGKIPTDWNYRRDLWDKLCDKHENNKNWDRFWKEIDIRYYENSKSIYQSLIDYLKSNAKLID
jgi:hypothetical protein